MKNWREVFNVKEFKFYETQGKGKLPNMAEFSGDKWPASGDSAKIELNAWHQGNNLSKKDREKEQSSTLGSSLLSKKINLSKDSSLTWKNVLSNVNFEQKPDGTVKIDVEYPQESNFSNQGFVAPVKQSFPKPPAREPAVNELEKAQKASSLSKPVKEWVIKREGSLVLKGRECEDACGIVIEKEGQIIDSQRVEKTGKSSVWNELINQGLWETKFDTLC